jgi:hypothetical protein
LHTLTYSPNCCTLQRQKTIPQKVHYVLREERL